MIQTKLFRAKNLSREFSNGVINRSRQKWRANLDRERGLTDTTISQHHQFVQRHFSRHGDYIAPVGHRRNKKLVDRIVFFFSL
jgi:hypothetical protein